MKKSTKIIAAVGGITAGVCALIGIGCLNYTQGVYGPPKPTASTLMDSKAISAYNSKYLSFEGTNKNPSNVRTLIMSVKAHNVNVQEVYDYGTFTINGIDETNKVDSKKKYDICDFVYDDSGVVIGCTIKEISND